MRAVSKSRQTIGAYLRLYLKNERISEFMQQRVGIKETVVLYVHENCYFTYSLVESNAIEYKNTLVYRVTEDNYSYVSNLRFPATLIFSKHFTRSRYGIAVQSHCNVNSCSLDSVLFCPRTHLKTWEVTFKESARRSTALFVSVK